MPGSLGGGRAAGESQRSHPRAGENGQPGTNVQPGSPLRPLESAGEGWQLTAASGRGNRVAGLRHLAARTGRVQRGERGSGGGVAWTVGGG